MASNVKGHRRHLLSSASVFVALVGLASSASAAADLPTLAMPGLGGGTQANTAQLGLIEDAIVLELVRSGLFRVIGPPDVEALLDSTQQWQVLACAKECSCLSELAAALDASYVVEAEATFDAATKALKLQLHGAGRPMATVVRPLGDDSETNVHIAKDAVQALVGSLVSRSSRFGAGFWALATVAAASVSVGAYYGTNARAAVFAMDVALNRAVFEAARDQATVNASRATISHVIGGAAAAAALLSVLIGGSSDSITVAPAAGGVAVVARY